MELSSVSTALSSNIPTGLLVDCCCESVSQFFFQLFVFFSGFSSLNFEGIQQCSGISLGEGVPRHNRGGDWHHNGGTHGAVSRHHRHGGVGAGSGRGLCYSTTRAEYINKII